jgi:4-amino-4-deoxy-L-arabinose transferase-like glycosyltransferase
VQPVERSLDDDRSSLTRGRTLLLVLGGYFLVNLLVRLVLPHGLELDEAEQTYFSQWLLAGYSSQPPFYNWLEYAAVHGLGMSLATLSLLKNVLLFTTYLFYWLAARQVMTDQRLAIVAALGLLTIPQVAFEAQRDLSHTVAAMFGVAFFFLAFLRVLSRPSLASFLLLGLATGIGGITKYNFTVVPIAAGLAALMDRDMRATLLNWRILPAGLISLVIVSPHAFWLINNFEAAGGHTMKKLVNDKTGFLVSLMGGFESLAVSTLGFIALTLVIFALVFREHLRSILRASNRWSRLSGRTLALCLGLIALMILFAGLENVRDRWLAPILLAAPLYLALKVDAANIPVLAGLRRLWAVAAVVMVLIPTILFGRVALSTFTGKYGYVNIPFAALSELVAQKAAGANTVVVASDGQLGGNIHFNQPELPVLTPRPPLGLPPQPLLEFERIVLVWRKSEGTTPPSLEEVFGAYLAGEDATVVPRENGVVAFPYAWGRVGDEYRFGYAVIDLPRQPNPTGPTP